MKIAPIRTLRQHFKDCFCAPVTLLMQEYYRSQIEGIPKSGNIEVTWGDHWTRGLTWNAFQKHYPGAGIDRVLVAGCGAGKGQDVKVWLENGIETIDRFDTMPRPDWAGESQRLSENMVLRSASTLRDLNFLTRRQIPTLSSIRRLSLNMCQM